MSLASPATAPTPANNGTTSANTAAPGSSQHPPPRISDRHKEALKKQLQQVGNDFCRSIQVWEGTPLSDLRARIRSALPHQRAIPVRGTGVRIRVSGAFISIADSRLAMSVEFQITGKVLPDDLIKRVTVCVLERYVPASARFPATATPVASPLTLIA